MFLCKGEEEIDENQCCLFTSVNHQDHRLTRQQLCGLSKLRLNEKKYQTADKETRFITKYNRLQKSQEKFKMSLSKLSKKKGNCTRDYIEQKETTNMLNSCTSASKQKAVQNPLNSFLASPSLPMSQTPRYNFNYPVMIKSNQTQQFVVPANTNQALIPAAKTRINTYENQTISTNQYPIQMNNRPNQVQKIFVNQRNQLQNFIQSTNNPSKLKLRSLTYRNTQPQAQLLQASQNRSVRIEESAVQDGNLLTLERTKGQPTLAPTLETERMMANSQTKQNEQFQLEAHQNVKTSQSLYKPPENEITQSRYTQNLLPDLGRPNLKTVQSIYSSQIGGKREKQVQESIILIDFFNPDEKVRRQIEQKIKIRNGPQFKTKTAF